MNFLELRGNCFLVCFRLLAVAVADDDDAMIVGGGESIKVVSKSYDNIELISSGEEEGLIVERDVEGNVGRERDRTGVEDVVDEDDGLCPVNRSSKSSKGRGQHEARACPGLLFESAVRCSAGAKCCPGCRL